MSPETVLWIVFPALAFCILVPSCIMIRDWLRKFRKPGEIIKEKKPLLPKIKPNLKLKFNLSKKKK